MLSLIATFLGLIPGLENVAATIAAKAFDAKVAIVQAKTGADRDTAIAIVQKAGIDSHESTEKWKAIAANPVLLLVVVIGGGPYFAYAWKCIVWDTMLGLGSTPAIKGDLAMWGNIVYTGLFGGVGAIALGSMWFNRKQT